MKDYILALTTCPESRCEQLARTLVEKKLCACVNIISGVKSIYFWKDEITMDSESILLIKTETKLSKKLRNIIIENHPYDLPEFITINIDSGSKEYLDWITANLLE